MDNEEDSDDHHFGSGGEDDDSSSDEERSVLWYEEEAIGEEQLNVNLQMMKEINPLTTTLVGIGNYERIQNMTDEELEELGRDISNNTHL